MNVKISLIYDYDPDGSKRNMWFVIDFKDPIPWTEQSMYLKVCSLESKDINELQDDLIGCSINLEELLVSPIGPDFLGFNLHAIQDRLSSVGIEATKIERFIVQAVDAKEVLTYTENVFI